MTTPACAVCKTVLGDGERFVLVRGGRQELHCSQICLTANVERRRRARAAAQRRWLSSAAAVGLIVVGVPRLWHRVRLPRPQTIVFEPPEIRPTPTPRPEPPVYGPAWPPTDHDWQAAFAETAWIYPLPGPARRAPAVNEHILASRPSAHRADPVCRVPARCGVDLGGELWGEHVYAAHDGLVDHVQHAGGDVYVRLSHFGGMVFTHYAHLAAAPRGIVRGAAVKAGDLIGLVGDTGEERPGRYVHFALSVHPASELPEVFWDPTPLMARWPLRLPPHGTVAGFVPPESDLAAPSLRRRPR